MGDTLGITQLGSGNNGLFDSDVMNILKDQGFTAYTGNNGLDLNTMTPETLKAAANDYTKFGNKINGFSNNWSFDGVLDGLGSYIGTDGQTLKDIGSGLGGAIGLGNTLFGMYNKNQATKLAKDNYNFQKNLAIKQMHQADADRARFLNNQKAATKSYYGK